ncbi:membrane protein CcdC involved in cytochrome C biogenesis [Paenibacillus phyllosphaerae]|uniref:Membrane protein CcdC involved in cytochrome C biogenesis n=1 Tax=Paenibacillus phyllosphaerae TaxID=274593 RepID=A0A7W5FP06_9BACL|nr:membrane protein CcdC involved in cytochrome C biogenesis [Paenibacillus phyllosphaerae]
MLPVFFIAASLTQLLDPSLHIREEQAILAIAIGVLVSIPLIRVDQF